MPPPAETAAPHRAPAMLPEPAGLSEVAKKRRDAIVEAAADIIATQGIHKLSLRNIEKRVGMTRGHLTYYFRTKESILLAVFDRMLGRMFAESMSRDGPKPGTGDAWDIARHVIASHLRPPDANHQALISLVHTFLAQMTYRPDFRARMALLNADMRGHVAADYARCVPPPPPARPAIAASIVLALLQGLGGQLAVDPDAFDRAEMLTAVTTLLAPLFGVPTPLPGDPPCPNP